MIGVLIFSGLLLIAVAALHAWDRHVSSGNARWRREWSKIQAQLAARDAEREAHIALTPADREWLEEMGWKTKRNEPPEA